MTEPIVYCADVGSVKNFGWARLYPGSAEPETGATIAGLVEGLIEDLRCGDLVALGFECPLWAPLPDKANEIGKVRPGEVVPGTRPRPWSAGAGALALTMGVAEVPWILRAVKREAAKSSATLDWGDFRRGDNGVFLWEAFVTDKAKGQTHVDDARIGAEVFSRLSNPRTADVCRDYEGNVASLIGAALIRTGWSDDTALLSQRCVVIRATAC